MSRDKLEKFKVDVSPEMRIYRILQHLNYNLETAFSEFIDNSIQSFLENKNTLITIGGESFPKLKISIEISTHKQSIIIKDNAAGIHRKDIARALKLGVDIGTVHSHDSLSVYGIGMKSAAIWFSDDWSITTSAIGIREKLNFNFNLNDLLKNNETDADVVPLEAGIDEHYTEIVLRNQIRTESKEHYQETIIPFIEETFHKFSDFTTIEFYYDDMLLKANNKKVLTELPETLVYPPVDGKGQIKSKTLVRWYLPLDFEYQERKVHGFIMIRKVGSYGQPGVRLLRNNRVIEGTSVYQNFPKALIKSKNKYSAQRIYGEFHLDSFPVDFMKTNFNENLKDFYSALNQKLTTEYHVNIFYQAENFRVRNIPDADSEKKLLKKIESESKAIDIKDLDGTIIENKEQNTLSCVPENRQNKTVTTTSSSDDDLRNKDNKDNKDTNDSSDTSGDSGSSNSSNANDTSGNKYEPLSENRIQFSELLNNALMKLTGNKTGHLYDSLCRLSLKQHSVLMYAGTWSFLETLTSLVGRNSNASFPDYLGTKINEFTKDKTQRAELKRVVNDISSRGNCTKHSGIYWNHTAMDLKPAFLILEPFLIHLVDNHMKNQVKAS